MSVVFGGAGVFAGAQEEVEGNDDDVGYCHSSFVLLFSARSFEDVEDDCDGYGFDTARRCIETGIMAELSLDAKVDSAYLVVPDVFGPHTGELLAHTPKGVLH